MCFRKQARTPWSYHIQSLTKPIALAIKQFRDDLQHVLEADLTEAAKPDQATLRLQHDPSLQTPESWQLTLTDAQITLQYADNLGAVYGIYHISEHMLGFDPLWFWKQILPAKRDELVVEQTSFTSTAALYTYRGWFLNDEDLLALWHLGGGQRELDYAHYQYVTSPYVIQRVCEALLRLNGNLIIPASFINVMNPAEAKLVSHAAEHGLYVSQHHIEPLGVSAFSFETYWQKRGEQHVFEYAKNPAPMLQAWKDYAQKWYELAGDQVIWQLGLRGRGDRPIWDYDKTITQEQAGQFISNAMEDQWQIISQIDSRPTPPATTTLWHEGAELMAKGQLNIPDPVTVIFSDKGQTQCMQEDFHNLARDPNRTYGAYYHAGFWIHGSHLVQGTSLSKMQREVFTMIDKGDTHYAILNTANIREQVMPIQAFAQLLRRGKGWQLESFNQDWCPGELRPLYERYFAALIPLPEERSIQDGYLWAITKDIAAYLAGQKQRPVTQGHWAYSDAIELPHRMLQSAVQLESIVNEFPPLTQLTADERRFFEDNLREQARMLGTMYRIAAGMLVAMDDHSAVSSVIPLVEKLLYDRQRLAQGPWENWYRGETKEAWRHLLSQLQSLVTLHTTCQPQSID
ncbi:MAG: glycosyl hydrolase 115 family protein [Phycisphaeraceae bacterium JB051]